MVGLPRPAELAVWVEHLTVVLHGRIAWRFPLLARLYVRAKQIPLLAPW